MSGPETPALWIAWERHRRSLVLAESLQVPIEVMISDRPYLWRILLLSLRTLRLLLRRRPRLVLVQNPSLVLAAWAAVLKGPLRFRLIVDRHSNFVLQSLRLPRPVAALFHLLSRYSVRQADLTIVTNQKLERVVAAMGGRGLVLPDRIPEFKPGDRPRLAGRWAIVFISAFGADEPLAEVIDAALLLGDEFHVYVTGDTGRLPPALRDQAPPNVHFTGFLPESQYVSLLAACDAALVLTRNADTLLCGAYEATALGRPMVMSDQEALTGYFARGRVLTDNSPASLAQAVRTACQERDRLQREVRSLANELHARWLERFASVKRLVAEWSLSDPASRTAPPG